MGLFQKLLDGSVVNVEEQSDRRNFRKRNGGDTKDGWKLGGGGDPVGLIISTSLLDKNYIDMHTLVFMQKEILY